MSKETEGKIIEAIENAEEVLEPLDVLHDEAAEHAVAPFAPKGQPTQASFLVELAADFELFHSPDGTSYADIYVDGHRETYPIASKKFEQELKRRFYEETADVARPEAVQKAKDLLEAKAQYRGETRQVYVRVGSLNGVLYLDLCDEAD